MEFILRLLLALLIFPLAFIIIGFFFYIVHKKRFFNFFGILTVSFGVGVGFGSIAFLATFIDEEAQNFNFTQRLLVGLDYLLWSFIGSILLLIIIILIYKPRLSKNKEKTDSNELQ